MTPTPEERAFLLRCADAWDHVAEQWAGGIDFRTKFGLCWTANVAGGYELFNIHSGRVPSLEQQLEASRPLSIRATLGGYWWPRGRARRRRAAHACRLAERCRALAGDAA